MSRYEDLRFWYLHELRRLRAQARNGHPTKTERRAIQRKLAELRGETHEKPSA